MKAQSPSQTQLYFSFPGGWARVLGSNVNDPTALQSNRGGTKHNHFTGFAHSIRHLPIRPKAQHKVSLPRQSSAHFIFQKTNRWAIKPVTTVQPRPLRPSSVAEPSHCLYNTWTPCLCLSHDPSCRYSCSVTVESYAPDLDVSSTLTRGSVLRGENQL